MLTMDDLRTRLNVRRQWLQLGLVSASVITPLVARWNDLRAAERARALAEEAESRLKGIGGMVPWTRRSARQRLAQLAAQTDGKALTRYKVSAGLWLAGASIGLIAASTAAYVLVRRRMAAATEEQMYFDLPSGLANGRATAQPVGAAAPAPSAVPAPSAPATSAQMTPLPAETGTIAGAAGITGTIATPTTAGNGAAAGTTPEIVPAGELPGGATTLTPEGERAGVADAGAAPFIGNIHTLIFHDADADELPAEENRIYFASEAEARAAGFRRDRDEVTAPESESTTRQSTGE